MHMIVGKLLMQHARLSLGIDVMVQFKLPIYKLLYLTIPLIYSLVTVKGI